MYCQYKEVRSDLSFRTKAFYKHYTRKSSILLCYRVFTAEVKVAIFDSNDFKVLKYR